MVYKSQFLYHGTTLLWYTNHGFYTMVRPFYGIQITVSIPWYDPFMVYKSRFLYHGTTLLWYTNHGFYTMVRPFYGIQITVLHLVFSNSWGTKGQCKNSWYFSKIILIHEKSGGDTRQEGGGSPGL
jgi:hypothetical protein